MKQDQQQGQDNSLETYNPGARNFQRPNEDDSRINNVTSAGTGADGDDADMDEDADDQDPVLTDEDLEENDLSEEDAEDIVWDEPAEEADEED